MFANVHALVRTLIIGILVLLAGWWTLFLRERFGEHAAALAERDAHIESLRGEVERKAGEIERLGQEVAARDERIAELDREIERLGREIQALQASLRLLKVDHRVARVEVLEQSPPAEGADRVRTRVRFTELDPAGEPLGPGVETEIEGRFLYVETLVIKFGDEFVEGGDALRGTSICLFRRLFGEDQSPIEGTPLDAEGTHPLVYGGDDPPDPFYRELWLRFWDYADDPELARTRGVRALHGEAPFVELRPGRSYRIELRSSGGLTMRVEE
ncbi:MAG: hypothetical protein AB1726_16460 [Planctomycetota bacterium]